ncbi:hypothetical protein TTHERM_000644729 (macronuclear) [Tetrahymena thermophila SB210]|uniref:Uncharacterized protein n=1 Tax=Tetrahymena thermophila (strain SB210) TaxID=312017 RepID=W7XID1_TETTS|nr:hypothetical protein TTHERM_000644729 [Tetrahymena thermophila SB210]EWS74526.1 hypothetical protein TTHERM_000644729 [Tetrahymena thermophila SB210]|eukprot:XP_012652956.1 hypothetical protein TTHERM_000644729 [Tetrahymena thermophila SB210]
MYVFLHLKSTVELCKRQEEIILSKQQTFVNISPFNLQNDDKANQSSQLNKLQQQYFLQYQSLQTQINLNNNQYNLLHSQKEMKPSHLKAIKQFYIFKKSSLSDQQKNDSLTSLINKNIQILNDQRQEIQTQNKIKPQQKPQTQQKKYHHIFLDLKIQLRASQYNQKIKRQKQENKQKYQKQNKKLKNKAQMCKKFIIQTLKNIFQLKI